MVTGHFAKRVFESLFVHIFSRKTIPISGFLKNFAHYWLWFGGMVSTEFCHFFKPVKLSNF
jgi:very-long-chain enoyl-CoA reductase